MPLIIAVMAGITASLIVVGLVLPNRSSATLIQRRVGDLEAEGTVDAYSGSLVSRVIMPLMRALTRMVTNALPGELIKAVDRELEAAGMRTPVSNYMSVWAALAVLIPLGTVLLAFLAGAELTRLTVFGTLFWFALWAYLPWYWLRRRSTTRARLIDRVLPDAIDLIVTGVEAGLGLQAAMMNVAEKVEGPVAEEFAQVIRDTSLGRPRDEALTAMADRAGSRDLRLFVRAVNQAEQMGISIAAVLRKQASEVRERRRQYARERAAKIPVKLTIPTVLFIFPTLFMILLAPVAMDAAEKLGGR